MKKTLVSFIGTGRKEQNQHEAETYIRTEYYDGNKQYQTALFVEALNHFRQSEITDCLLIGTHGSSWGALLEAYAYEKDRYVDLFDELEQAFSEKNVDKSLLTQLAGVLSREWQIDVKCEVHESEITDQNVLPVFYQYVTALEQYNSGTFLLDVTHSLRSMPLILLSSLSTLESVLGNVELEIVYGELLGNQKNAEGNKIGMVRSLHPIWHEQKFNQALRHFSQNFDGQELAKQIENEWQSGATAIRILGDTIQANYVTQLDKAIKHATTAIDAFNKIAEPSPRIKLAAQALKSLKERISSKKYHHEQILILAELLKERRLWGQAIITLELSFEAYLFYHYVEVEDQYGDFELTKNLRLQFIDELDTTNRKHCNNLYYTRNSIAHGGTPSNDGKEKKLQDLPSQYGTYSLWLKDLYKGNINAIPS